MNTAEKIFDEVRILPESQAREVLDFVGYLKSKLKSGAQGIQGVSEFDQFGVVFDGQFKRDECYDRQNLS